MIRQDIEEARAIVERVRKAQLDVNDMVDFARIDIGLVQIQKAVEDLCEHHGIGSSAQVLALLGSISHSVTQIRRHLELA